MRYKGILEFYFDSNLEAEELEELLQPVLIELNNDDIESITIDNKNSNMFAINEYIKTDVKEICPECESEIEYRIFDIDGTTLQKGKACSEDEEHWIN